MTIPHQALAEEDKTLALTREVDLDTRSFDSSAEEMSESGRSFQSLIPILGNDHLIFMGEWGRKIYRKKFQDRNFFRKKNPGQGKFYCTLCII